MWSRKRRDSKDAPPNLADSMNKLIAAAAEFIELFDRTEPEMRDIVEEFMKISEEVETIQRGTDVSTSGALFSAVLLNLEAAPLTGGLSLLLSGACLVASGTLFALDVAKVWKKNQKVNEVGKWWKKFMELVEPLKEKLEKIKIISEELERQSSEVMALCVVARVADGLRTSLSKILSMPSANEILRQSIIQTAGQSQEVIDQLVKMRSSLIQLREGNW